MGIIQSIEERLDPNHKYHHSHVDPLAVRLMLPVYFMSGKLSKEDIVMAKNSWDIIATNSSPLFQFNKERLSPTEFPYENASAWFYAVYFERLFDVHPLSRTLFPDTKAHNRFFQALLGFIFTAISEERAYKSKLKLLALSHCRKGVKAIEYGIVGEVMFWALKQCLGDWYDKATHTAWVKVFSNMLSVIIPAAVSYELDSNASQEKRLVDARSSHAYSFRLSSNPRTNDYDVGLLGDPTKTSLACKSTDTCTADVGATKSV